MNWASQDEISAQSTCNFTFLPRVIISRARVSFCFKNRLYATTVLFWPHWKASQPLGQLTQWMPSEYFQCLHVFTSPVFIVLTVHCVYCFHKSYYSELRLRERVFTQPNAKPKVKTESSSWHSGHVMAPQSTFTVCSRAWAHKHVQHKGPALMELGTCLGTQIQLINEFFSHFYFGFLV